MKNIATTLTGSIKAALLVLTMAAFAPAQATVIVDHSNGGIDNGTNWYNAQSVSLWDDFTLTSAASINAITYFTTSKTLGLANYTLSIGTAAGLSDVYTTTIANASATRSIVNGYGVVNASFSTVTLAAGTYWLTFNSADALNGSANVTGASAVQYNNGVSYIVRNSATSFILSGNAAAVPEPGSLALLGLGLFGIVAIGRRQGRKQA